ncbi:hypothetical protein EsH8_I_001605 [Colletotrichum jinshuiense]
MDITLLTFGCLGTFIKYIDRLMETAWTICTFGQAFMHTPLQMYVMRFLLGLFETGHWSSIIYLCGGWYQKRELARRIAIMNCATSIGPMFSSYLQAAAYSGLNGVHGFSGWRWEIEMARDRNPKEGRIRQGAFTWAQAKRCITTPDIYLLWLISVCNSVAHLPSDSMSFWFKAWNTIKPGSYTVPQINNYTTPLGGVTVILTLIFAWSSDTWLKGRRWPLLVVGGFVTGIVCILLAATPVFPEHKAFRWFLYYNTNWAFAANTMFWSWTQDTLSGDPLTRSFASAGLNVCAWTTIAVVPLFAFKTVDQPVVTGGNWGAAGMSFLYAIAALTLAYIQHKREEKKTVDSETDPISSG